MTDFISYWNQEIWEAHEDDPAGLSSSYLPESTADSRVRVGDMVYMVGLKDGELLPITRIRVRKVTPQGHQRADELMQQPRGTIGLLAEDEPSAPINVSVTLDPADADQLIVLTPSGLEPRHLKRQQPSNRILPHNFMGKNSVRRLAKGASILDRFFDDLQ